MPDHRSSLQRTGAAKAGNPGPLLLFAWLIATVVFSETGCGQRNKTGAQDSAAETVSVARRQFASTVSAVGAVKPQVGAEVKVGSRISGRVERLHANIKDQVRKGQVIAELEKADLEAIVAQRRAEARLAEAKLAALTELLPKDVAKAEAEVTRYEASVALAHRTWRDSAIC